MLDASELMGPVFSPAASLASVIRRAVDRTGYTSVRLRVVALHADGRIRVEYQGKAVEAASATEVPLDVGQYAWCTVRPDSGVIVLGPA